MEYLNNPPDASSLMMSARSFGNYDLASALADLIDNSITAKSKDIKLTCLYNNGDPYVSILDNGLGMSKTKLHKAMRPASTNPAEERSPDDLGRFGWGMKSASFSQCKKLTVISKTKSDAISGAVWNLDDIDQWKMGVLDKSEIDDLTFDNKIEGSGTLILWSTCDRLSEDGKLTEEEFNDLIVHTRDRLALVFHKFLAGDVRGKKIAIALNGQSIEPFDPFHKSNNATIPLEVEEIRLAGKGRIKIEPFVLPHFSKISPSDYERLGGEEGFVKNQGFYVYRNHRLILNGTWFRLVRHGELSQLVRVSVDIPNTLDEIWKITVDKSDAQLPTALRNRLKVLVEGLKKKSSKVYRSKGGKIKSSGVIHVWSKFARHGEVKYFINREHPLISSVLDTQNSDFNRAAETALGIIEQAFPVTSFGEDVSKHPDSVHQTETDPRKFIEALDAAIPLLLIHCGGDIPKLVKTLQVTEPYNTNWQVVKDYLIEKRWINEEP